MAREKSILAAIIRELKARKAWYVKYHGGKWGRVGVPDLLVGYRGRFIAIEVKQPGEKPTRAQAFELSRLEKVEAIAVVATSRQQVVDVLDRVEREALRSMTR